MVASCWRRSPGDASIVAARWQYSLAPERTV
jgi:hypothetical protein